MITLDYNINATKNGGKITAFTYSRSLNELCGSWSANVAGGTFKAGEAISFGNVMTNGIISRAKKDSSGLWHVDGYDAGIKLMRSLPAIETLPSYQEGIQLSGDAHAVIAYLADLCGISLVMSGRGLSEQFSVRSLISGSTCAEAILELAMFSGMIAFVSQDGKLHVQSPANKNVPVFSHVIDDSGSDFDLDGYATQATIVLRKNKIEDETITPSVQYYTGNYSGNFPEAGLIFGVFFSFSDFRLIFRYHA